MADFLRQLVLPHQHERDTIVVFNFNIILVNFARQTTPSIFAIFTFIVPVLLTFVQIRFPGGAGTLSSPFVTHHTKFMLAILSLLAFCCLAVAATRNLFPNHSTSANLRVAIKCTASLSVASLVSLLLPKPWDQAPYVTYFLYFTVQLLGNIIQPYFHQVAYGLVRWLRVRRRRSLRGTSPPLPVTIGSRLSIADQAIANIMEIITPS